MPINLKMTQFENLKMIIDKTIGRDRSIFKLFNFQIFKLFRKLPRHYSHTHGDIE